MGKNKAYNTGINTKVITVPTSNPPIIVTAREPNKSSPSKGIIPRIVVKEAIITGRKREDDESSKATNLPLPEAICKVISSSNTTPFLIIIPINPKAPTIATKPKSFPLISIPKTMPIAASGKQRKIIVGLRKSLNSMIKITIIITIAQGTFLKRYRMASLLALCSPSHCFVYPSGKVIVSTSGINLPRTLSLRIVTTCFYGPLSIIPPNDRIFPLDFHSPGSL